jgi:predicted DCC family thiol-disulfide oxidoreductase YuxK
VRWTLFYDADCGLCSALVDWIAKSDRRGRVLYLPLQGEMAKKWGFSAEIDKDGRSMVIVRDADGAVFTDSEACLELARALGGFWRLALILRMIPRRLSDLAYRTVSRHRQSLWRCGDRCGVKNSAEKPSRH